MKQKTYSTNTLISCNFLESLEKSFIVIAILICKLLLPQMRNSLLEVSLNSPIRPLILSRLLRVLIQKYTSVESPLATLRLPTLTAAGPVRLPQQLLRVYASNCSGYSLSRVAKVPSSWMAKTCLLMIIHLFEDLSARPIQAVSILLINFLLLIRRESSWSSRISSLIRHDCGISKESRKSSK